MNIFKSSFTFCGKSFFVLLFVYFCFLNSHAAIKKPIRLVSPNHNISINTSFNNFSVFYKSTPVLDFSVDGHSNFVFQHSRKITDNYIMNSGKRRVCRNKANEYVARLSDNFKMILRIYDDGIAFRYEYSSVNDNQPLKDPTVYVIKEGTKRWMQQWTDSYEGFFPLTDSYKQKPVPSYSGISKSSEGWNNRWGYPALIQTSDNIFALITEANIERNQSASCLYNEGDRFRVVNDNNELPLPELWHSPWRVLIVGNLADIVESTLVTDVSESSKIVDTKWIQPGVVSWIYWAYNHGSNDMTIIRKYVDMASSLRLPYVLIDAEWDQMKDGFTIVDAIQYAKQKGVKPLIWYNSSVGWTNGAPTPQFRLNKSENREKEFQWCEDNGVAGVKIDFFSGDNQKNMDYCLDLLESAARHHLLVNFHGATIPRGWQRTWPNLLSTEGVYGAEWYNNVPTFTEKAASHNATLPFTRNVVGPMDYTPCTFSDSQHPHITTNAHELALTVLFESGLQHLADKPESYFAQPREVQDFLSNLPAAWDDTRFIDGYPGDYAVIARKANSKWYIAGINGTDSPKDININVKELIKGKVKAQLFFDTQDSSSLWSINNTSVVPNKISCLPRGGFVIVISKI